MAKITALLHTHNDAERVGRALESLRACDEVLVVDHASTDDTVKIARDHGATVKEGVPGVNPGVYAIDARYDWVLCILPNEALDEALEASLFGWKDRTDSQCCGISMKLREETGNGWKELGTHTRLVNRKKVNWQDHLPADDPAAELLPGHLLRFAKP
jgi:glycosyltransferase involved in cell wall biosynthesis